MNTAMGDSTDTTQTIAAEEYLTALFVREEPRDGEPVQSRKLRKARARIEMLRELEVYKYSAVFNSLNIDPSQRVVRIRPDDTLQMFAHLAAVKSGSEHCLISLIDSRSQYIIAEGGISTPFHSSQLLTPLLGSAKLPLEHCICAQLIEIVNEGRSTSLFIDDLTANDRTKNLPYVQNKPFMRSYAGVPLFSPSGALIGSLLALSSSVRTVFEKDSFAVLTHTATLVRTHLEYIRTTENHRRGERMVKGLALFVAGMSDITEIETTTTPMEVMRSKTRPKTHLSRRTRTQESHGEAVTNHLRIPLDPNENDSALRTEVKGHTARTQGKTKKRANSGPKSPTFGPHTSSNTKNVFDRACKILNQSLEVDISFYDASVGSFGGYLHSALRSKRKPIRRKRKPADPLQTEESSNSSANEGSDDASSQSRSSSTVTSVPKDSSTSSEDHNCALLGFARHAQCSLDGDVAPVELQTMRESFLRLLLEYYPQGKVFNLETIELLSSSDDSAGSANDEDLEDFVLTEKSRPQVSQFQTSQSESSQENVLEDRTSRRELRRRKVEKEALEKLKTVFPGSRTVLFCPLWDFNRERWLCAGFVSSSAQFRVLSNQEDLNYLTCFGNSMLSEISRIDAINSDLAKTGFISTMSHELRSPLHGILASSELLRETAASSFQEDLVSTIDRCGAILLDSINQVLDFTKVSTIIDSLSDKPQLQVERRATETLLRNIDLSVVVDESMEGIFSGFGRRRLFKDQDWVSGNDSKLGQASAPPPENDVFCILDIDHSYNWVYYTQPGAWTRIINNLFSNSLKYTEEGFIRVSLRARLANELAANRIMIVELVVSDSGQGMSHEFLEGRLFKPFAQENNLAAGTGLGLSIVSQLVTALGGTIDVRSEHSFGTDIRVCVPIPDTYHVAEKSGLSDIPMSVAEQVKQRTKGLELCLVGFSKLEDDEAGISGTVAMAKGKCLRSVEASLRKMGRDWFRMEVTTCRKLADATGDVVIVYESEFVAGEEQRKANASLPALTPINASKAVPLIVLCKSRASFEQHSRENSTAFRSDVQHIVELVTLPCGPHKFARVLSLCLDQAEAAMAKCAADVSSLSVLPTKEPFSTQVTPLIPTHEAPRPLLERTLGERPGTPGSVRPGTPNSVKVSPLVRPKVDVSGELSRPVTGDEDVSSLGLSPDPGIEVARMANQGPRILIVDDNEINLRLLEIGIKRDGHRYETAINGEQAVNIYKAADGGFDIIFMDINMPIMDGMQATRQIRKYEKENEISHARVVALTGLASQNAEDDAVTVGIDLFLTKPASFQKIRAVIVDWVESNIPSPFPSP